MPVLHKDCLLTIYIATYNRMLLLSELLDLLSSEVSGLGECRDQVEIVVSDNKSTDNTVEVVNKYIENEVVDRIVLNKKNLGADLNMLGAKINSRGRYVWLLCDDDIPINGSINIILELINIDNQAGSIYLDRIKEERSGGLISETALSSEQTGLVSSKSIIDIIGQDLITASCLVLDRQSFFGEFTLKYGYSGRYCAPLALAIDAMSLNGNAYITKKPVVRYIYGDTSNWSVNWYWIWLVSIPMILVDADTKFNSGKKTNILVKVDYKKTLALLLMLKNKKAWPKINSDWFWILFNLFTQGRMYLYIVKALIRKILGRDVNA